MNAQTICFLLILVCLGFSSAFSQYGLRLTNLEHAGVYNEVFKPALVPEISYVFSDIDDRFVASFGIGYGRIQARQDTFFSYGVLNGSTVIPSYDVYKQIKIVPLTFYYAVRPFEGPLRPLLGLSLNANFLIFNYDSRTVGFINKTVTNESLNSIGIMPFIGGSYQVGYERSFQLEVGHQIGYDSTKSWNRQWRTSLSIVFYLE